MECPNCGSKKLKIIGIQPRTPNPRGKSPSPKNSIPEYIQQGAPLTSSDNSHEFLFNSKSDDILIEAKKKQYYSEEFKMLLSPSEEDEENSDNVDINDIEQSANDLAIDG
jgi:hypothetical protein